MFSTSLRLGVAACAGALCVFSVLPASADTFGTGANAFTMDFVTVSAETNPTSGYGIVSNDYRIGVYEVTTDQWNKFQTSLGVPVTGSMTTAYDSDAYWTGVNQPANNVSWYEMVQFVNWMNTSTGHHAAYNFTGSQGTGDYTFATWSAAEADGGTNLYRHKDAVYYLPTEHEWMKAAYWNGTTLQTHATKPGETVFQGDGVSGTGWNYQLPGPWDVGSGSEELNGTYDMMGNIWEWMESPYADWTYGVFAHRPLRGGRYDGYLTYLSSDARSTHNPDMEYPFIGFRIAADVLLSALPGDFNGDQAVTGADYVLWADHFGGDEGVLAAGTGNGDGTISGADYVLWANNFGNTASATIPEPVTLSLLTGGAMAMLRRRR